MVCCLLVSSHVFVCVCVCMVEGASSLRNCCGDPEWGRVDVGLFSSSFRWMLLVGTSRWFHDSVASAGTWGRLDIMVFFVSRSRCQIVSVIMSDIQWRWSSWSLISGLQEHVIVVMQTWGLYPLMKCNPSWHFLYHECSNPEILLVSVTLEWSVLMPLLWTQFFCLCQADYESLGGLAPS